MVYNQSRFQAELSTYLRGASIQRQTERIPHYRNSGGRRVFDVTISDVCSVLSGAKIRAVGMLPAL